MESQHDHRLNPLALAIATGVAAIALSLLIGLPAMGIRGMMGGGYGGYGGYGNYGGHGWMMGNYGGGSVLAFGIMWLVGALAIALAGAIVAWVYNAAHSARPPVTADHTPSGESPLPKS